MQINRDYSSPLFGKRKQRRASGRLLFVFGLAVGVMLVFVVANRETLQEDAMDMLGMGPTATPFPSDLANIAANLVLSGQTDQAASLFEEALQQRPDNIDYLHEYGQLLIDEGDTDRAIEFADRILTLNPADPRGYALKARAYVWASNPTSAIPVALAGIDIAPDYAPLYTALGRAYTDTGQYLDGVDAGFNAVQADPGDVQARRAYAYSLSWVSENLEAIAQLEAAISLDSTHIPAYFELALQYLAQDRDQDAIDLYNAILALQPRNARAMLRLCETYRKVGQFNRAVGFCEDAVSADPTNVSALYQLGLLYYNDLEFPKALNTFASCVEADPQSLNCTYRLGLSFYYVHQSNQCVGSVNPLCTERDSLPLYDTDDCTSAWNILQDALIMAQNRQGTEEQINHIREGLTAVGRLCPQYGSIVPVPELPEITPEAQDSTDGGA